MYAFLFILLVVANGCFNNVKAAACAESNYCLNGATCVDLGSSVICICTPGWAGDLCDYPEISSGKCTVNPCLNGAKCSFTSSGGFRCTCPPNFTGSLCETFHNTSQLCYNTLCFNGATFVDAGPNSYQCICAPGYTGYRCTDRLKL